MEIKELIAKINYYSKISRARELTKEETEERQKYRKLYIEMFRQQVKNELEKIEIVD